MAGGRRSPHGGGTISTDPPAASIACLALAGEGVGLHGERLRELTAAEHLHQAPLGDEAPGPQRRRGRPRCRRVERLERVEVDHVVLDPERVVEALEPSACGGASGVWPPSNPGLTEPRAPWPFMPRPAVLPPLPPMPRPTRLARLLASRRPASGHGSSCGVTFLDHDEVRHLGQHPADHRRVVVLDGLADAGAGRARAACRAASA